MADDKIRIFSLLKATAKEWFDEDPFRQSAVVAYYSIFSLPALLIIIIWIAGAVFGQQAVQGELSSQVSQMIGKDAGEAVETMIISARQHDDNFFLKLFGIATLIFGSTTVFFQLQKSINHIWEVQKRPDANWKKVVFDRLSSLGLVVVIGFLLLISLLLSALIAALSNWIKSNFTNTIVYLAEAINTILTIGLATVLFAAMFRFLPDVEITWSMVWKGALVTAILFVIGKFLLGLYFTLASPESSYGAAGSIILILLWVNYTCLIIFFGAEFTQVYARRRGTRIIPSEHAQWVRGKRKGSEPGSS